MQRQDNYMEPDKVVVKSTPIDDDDGNEPEDLAGKDKDDKNMSKDRISGDYRSRFSISHSSQNGLGKPHLKSALAGQRKRCWRGW